MYLVIGANGYLGRYVVKSIIDKTDDKVVATARNIDGLADTDRLFWKKVDITDDESFDSVINNIEDKNNLKVVFLAAYHNPDMVEKNPLIAWNVNVTCLSKCINKLSDAKRLFYASTDSVYGNSYDGYHFKEDDVLNPVNTYGMNKCAAEAIVIWKGFNVVRFPFLIAHSLVPGRLHFYDKIVDDLKGDHKIEMFNDSYRSSLNFQTAADLLIDLEEMQDKVPPVLNVCGDKDLSKYDIGVLIANKICVGKDKLVMPISVEMNKNIFEAKRAKSTLMDNTKLKKILGLKTIDFVI